MEKEKYSHPTQLNQKIGRKNPDRVVNPITGETTLTCTKCSQFKKSSLGELDWDSRRSSWRPMCKACRKEEVNKNNRKKGIKPAFKLPNSFPRQCVDCLEYLPAEFFYLRTNLNIRMRQCVECIAQQRADNRDFLNVVRRHRDRQIKIGMTAEDRDISVQYRKVIKKDPCFYCGDHTSNMHVDHAIPLSRGGTDHWFNLRQSCSTCNNVKYTKTEKEFIEYRSNAKKTLVCYTSQSEGWDSV